MDSVASPFSTIQGCSHDVKDVYCGFSVALLEAVLELCLLDVPVESVLKFGVYFVDFL